MKDEPGIDARRAVAEQAALWMLSLQSGTLSPAQRAEFAAWLRESPLHIAEMLRICKLHRCLVSSKHWRRMAPVDVTRSSNILHIQPRLASSAGVTRGGRLSAVRGRGAWLVAASVAALCVIGFQLHARLDRREFRTEPGERRELTLPDGSLAKLAPNSDMVVKFRQRERLIELEHGEATFYVARNPNRPFVVQAAMTRILAVGTVFNVERGAQSVSVAVVEGRVAVSQEPAPHLLKSTPMPAVPTLNLGADERVSIDLAGVASPVRRLKSGVPAGSEPGELTFDNETLAEVAHRFNQSNRVQIDILNSSLGGRRVSGVFRADDPQSFVDFIRATAGARATWSDTNHITLSLPADGRGDVSR